MRGRSKRIIAQGIISLFLWTIFHGTLSSSNQMNQFHCLRTILNHYNNLHACPWNISGSCSAPNFVCYQNDSLCDLTFYLPTNISIVVFWSSVPILQDKRTVTSNCRCKEVTFSCHIAIEDNIQDLCDDGSMLTTTVTTEGLNSATCPQKNGTSVGEIFGAMLGGAALCLLVIAISYLVLRKYRNIKQKQTTKDPIENATQNPAYGSTPNLVAMDNQRGSKSMETSHIYDTISDNTKKVPHDQTKVRYELGTPRMSRNIDLGTYNHLNEVNNKAESEVAQLPQNDYDHMNNTAANEYTEVVGDGFLN